MQKFHFSLSRLRRIYILWSPKMKPRIVVVNKRLSPAMPISPVRQIFTLLLRWCTLCRWSGVMPLYPTLLSYANNNDNVTGCTPISLSIINWQKTDIEVTCTHAPTRNQFTVKITIVFFSIIHSIKIHCVGSTEFSQASLNSVSWINQHWQMIINSHTGKQSTIVIQLKEIFWLVHIKDIKIQNLFLSISALSLINKSPTPLHFLSLSLSCAYKYCNFLLHWRGFSYVAGICHWYHVKVWWGKVMLSVLSPMIVMELVPGLIHIQIRRSYRGLPKIIIYEITSGNSGLQWTPDFDH